MFIATALTASMLFSLMAVVPGADGTFAQEIKYSSELPIFILIIISSILNLLALTTYRFRVFQMRTAVLSALITIALQAWIAVKYFSAPDGMVFRYTAVFPLASIIFNLLAARGIASDIMVAESVNHLRSRKKKR